MRANATKMAGDDDDDVTDDAMTSSTLGLPASVMSVLHRMSSHGDRLWQSEFSRVTSRGDRLSWSVAEDASRVSLSLSWDVRRPRHQHQQQQVSRQQQQASTTDDVSSARSRSLWKRIRRTLHIRRSASAEAAAASTSVANEAHSNGCQAAVTSREGRSARSAREQWRQAVQRERSESVTRSKPTASGFATSLAPSYSSPSAAWGRHRQSSWNEIIDDVCGGGREASELRSRRASRRLQSSLSLPERFSAPHESQEQHRQQQQRQQHMLQIPNIRSVDGQQHSSRDSSTEYCSADSCNAATAAANGDDDDDDDNDDFVVVAAATAASHPTESHVTRSSSRSPNDSTTAATQPPHHLHRHQSTKRSSWPRLALAQQPSSVVDSDEPNRGRAVVTDIDAATAATVTSRLALHQNGLRPMRGQDSEWTQQQQRRRRQQQQQHSEES